MTQQTAFEKFWKKECKANGVKDTDSAFKAFALHGWNAAIEAAASKCDELKNKHDIYVLYPPNEIAEEVKEEIQKLRS